MMWQDMVFLIGSMTSVAFLYPTLRNAASRVPRATSIPSMLIGGAYSFTFLTLGMTFSAVGSFAACTMWSLIAAFRAPDDGSLLEDPRVARVRRRLGLAETTVEHSPGDASANTLSDGIETEFDVATKSD